MEELQQILDQALQQFATISDEAAEIGFGQRQRSRARLVRASLLGRLQQIPRPARLAPCRLGPGAFNFGQRRGLDQ